MYAAYYGHQEVVQLIGWGVDATYHNHTGSSALKQAAGNAFS
jgi:hypothetical protein